MTALPALNRDFSDEETTDILKVLREPPIENSLKLHHASVQRLLIDLIGSNCWGIAIDGEVMYNKYDKSRSEDEIIRQENVRKRFMDEDEFPGQDIYHHMLSHDCKTCEVYMIGNLERAWKLVAQLEKGDPMQPETNKWTISCFGNYLWN